MGTRWIAKPGFLLCIPYHWEYSQTGFWLCPHRRSSVPPEPIFGPPRYFFKGVPPQPNCPPAAVPVRTGERYGNEWLVLHRCLHLPRRAGFDGSQLHSASATIPQQQAAVKLHRVFSPRQRFVDCSSTLCGFTGLQAGTAGPSLFHSCTSELTRQGIWLP